MNRGVEARSLEIGNWKLEIGNWKLEIGNSKTKNQEPRTKDEGVQGVRHRFLTTDCRSAASGRKFTVRLDSLEVSGTLI
jgi:hypothetical protein